MDIKINIIPSKDIISIIPLLTKLNSKTPISILKERVIDMSRHKNYECVGLFLDNKLIGITGLWFTTRHYIGKTVETDHVIIYDSFRGKKLGEKFFKWIDKYVKSKDCEGIELNTYVSNQKSHKFYYNQGYNIYGFHFLKVLRDDKKFY